MRNGEFPNPADQLSFEDAVDLISKLVEPHMTGYLDEYGEVGYPGWDGSIRRLDLEPEVAVQAGLGDSVRARIIGDYVSGIAIIMRSRNLFDTHRYGFYLQRQRNAEGSQGLEVWQAPAQRPKRGKIYWGFELLDHQQAQPSSPKVSDSLIKTFKYATR